MYIFLAGNLPSFPASPGSHEEKNTLLPGKNINSWQPSSSLRGVAKLLSLSSWQGQQDHSATAFPHPSSPLSLSYSLFSPTAYQYSDLQLCLQSVLFSYKLHYFQYCPLQQTRTHTRHSKCLFSPTSGH